MCYTALACTEGVGPATFRELIEAYGSCCEVIRRARKRSLVALPRMSAKTADAILRVREEVGRWKTLLKELDEEGIQVVLQSDGVYPQAFLVLDHPPPLLFVLGDLRREDERGLGIVGTTRPTAKGRQIAKEAARMAARRGCTVVSGLAKGVDSAAHLGAISMGGRTVAFPAAGLRKVPRTPEFREPRAIQELGGLVSPFPPDSSWQIGNAMLRNRLIAAMSTAVFVVEPGPKGGATYTADFAGTLGKPVYTLSDRQRDEDTEGNRKLLERGAKPISCYADVERMIEGIGAGGE